MKRLLMVALMMVVLLLSGCMAAAVGYMAYKLHDAKVESAEKAQRSQDLRTYAQYRVQMETVNLARARDGLAPSPIMTQDEWMTAQTAGRPAIAPE